MFPQIARSNALLRRGALGLRGPAQRRYLRAGPSGKADESEFSLEQVLAKRADMDEQDQPTGLVVDNKDNIVTALGLSSTSVSSLVRFQSSGKLGLVLTLEKKLVRIAPLERASTVRRDEIVEPVEDSLSRELILQRLVVDRPSSSEEGVEEQFELFKRAPKLAEFARRPVPLVTGVLAVDMFSPIRFGQRLSLVGQLGTGKRRLALDVARHQLDLAKQHASSATINHVIWASIGYDQATVDHYKSILGHEDACTFVSATFNDPSALQYLVSHVAVGLAESHRSMGQNVLLVVDNAAAHGAAYETVMKPCFNANSMAFPQAVQPLASVLERCGAVARSGDPSNNMHGSITSLVLLDTDESTQSEKAVEQLGMMTDGTITLSSQYANINVAPAIDPTEYGLESLPPHQLAVFRALALKLKRVLYKVSNDVGAVHMGKQFGLKPEYDGESMHSLSYFDTLCAFLNQCEDRRAKSVSFKSVEQEYLSMLAAAEGFLDGIHQEAVGKYKSDLYAHMMATPFPLADGTPNGDETMFDRVTDLVVRGQAACGFQYTPDINVEAVLKRELGVFTEAFKKEHGRY